MLDIENEEKESKGHNTVSNLERCRSKSTYIDRIIFYIHLTFSECLYNLYVFLFTYMAHLASNTLIDCKFLRGAA